MRQVTLISLYGQKRPDLADFIAECQKRIRDAAGTAFIPYDLRQVHATIIGLERRIGSPLQNLNLWKHQGGKAGRMDIGEFLNHLHQALEQGLHIQIGGFEDRLYPFFSRNAIPFSRSFSIQADKVVVMGWPINEDLLGKDRKSAQAMEQQSEFYPETLDDLRRSAQIHNILHAFHHPENNRIRDNDLYFRIGLIDPTSITYKVGQETEARLRKYLSDNPLQISITLNDLYIASYKDERLPLESTKVWSLADDRVTKEFVENLYE